MAATLMTVVACIPGLIDTCDRRFYRSKHDAADTLAEFADRLRDQVELDALRTELLVAATSTFQPTHASLCLRQERSS